MTLKAALESAFRQDSNFTLTQQNDTAVRKYPSVFCMWGGMQLAGTSRFLRTVIHVVIILGPMETADPHKDAEDVVMEAIDVCHTCLLYTSPSPRDS